MDDPDYVRYWVQTHTSRAGLSNLEGQTVLELGPGDSVASAIVARGLGAERVVLVDAAPFATTDVAIYQRLCQQLRGELLYDVDLSGASDFADVLTALSAEYLTEGLSSLTSLDTASIDVSWSQAVLEHVRLHEIRATVAELHRLHRPGTATSHRVDLQDHLGRSLHSLRFRDRTWESPLLRRADFYTNRLRHHQLSEIFETEGFSVDVVAQRRWDDLPISRAKLAAPFDTMPKEDLLVFEFDFVARRSN